MPEQLLGAKEKTLILSHFVEVTSPKALPEFCVDGRKGSPGGIYLQALGGSYHLVTLNWLLSGGRASEYKKIQQESFFKLKRNNYRVSVHRGSHAHEGERSDCGFADNNGAIIKTLGERSEEVWQWLTEVEPDLEQDKAIWDNVIRLVKRAEVDGLPKGEDLIKQAVDGYQADLQTLEGEHQEIAAVVNLRQNTTLDVDRNQETQAFNLDLWFVLEQAKDLGLDEKRSLPLSLGLYVATEMVLVENKGKPRLPIIVRK